jgi:hypothetical protein
MASWLRFAKAEGREGQGRVGQEHDSPHSPPSPAFSSLNPGPRIMAANAVLPIAGGTSPKAGYQVGAGRRHSSVIEWGGR